MAEGWYLSGFADEISPDLEQQVEVLAQLGIHHVDFRGAEGRGVLEFSPEEWERIRRRFADGGIAVAAVGSPVGKVPISTPFSEEWQRFERALSAARHLGTRRVRIFSFYMQPGEVERYREEVAGRLQRMAARAAEEGVVLLHENERGIYGQTPEACVTLLEDVRSPFLRQVYDAANFLVCGISPYPEAFRALLPYVAYVHVKDARLSTGAIVPAGEGDARYEETFRELWAFGYRGAVSLEPHLAAHGAPGGGPEQFRRAAEALRRVMAAAGIPEVAGE